MYSSRSKTFKYWVAHCLGKHLERCDETFTILTPEDFNEPKFKQVQWLLNFDTDASLLCNEHMMEKLQSTLLEKTG